MIARLVRVTGRVQGVFFRAWTKDQARELGLSGWVRNCGDGSVEAHVEGEESKVSELIARMRSGPPSARVEQLGCEEIPPKMLSGFEVTH
jgi:acylphosphatase